MNTKPLHAALAGILLFTLAPTAWCADEPVGVRLSGHCSANIYGNIQTWQFEIVMDGFDHYYRKEWSGEQNPIPADGVGFSNVVFISEDFAGKMGHSWGSRGSRGGGASEPGGGKYWHEVARRLWQDDKFRGLRADELQVIFADGRYTEVFSKAISSEHFPVPLVITWTENGSQARTTSYTVEKVEFLYRHDPQFFADVRKKYFSEMDGDKGPAQPGNQQASPSPAQPVANRTLQEPDEKQDAAIKELHAALAKVPIDRPRGAYLQSALMARLWQIAGMKEKEELVNWFYQALQYVPAKDDSRDSETDNGAVCLLRAVETTNRNETAALLTAIIADPRFVKTDPAAVVRIMDMSREGLPIPSEIYLNEKRLDLPEISVQEHLLPLWRNVLRRHYGLPGYEKEYVFKY